MADSGSDTTLMFKQSGITFLGNIFGRIFGLLFYVTVTRLTSPSNFGLYTLGLSIILLVEKVASLNLHTSVDYYVPKYLDEGSPEQARNIVLTVFVISIPTTILVGAIIYTFRYNIEALFNTSGLASVLTVFAFLVPLLFINKTIESVFVAVKKMELRVAQRNVAKPIFKLTIIGGLIFSGFELFGLLIGHVIMIVSTIVIGLLLLRSRTGFIRDLSGGGISPPQQLLDYSLPLMFAGIIYAVVGQLDYYLIGYFIDSSQVGIYRIGYLLAGYVLIFHDSLVPIFKPLVVETESDEKALNRNYELATKWVMISTLPVASVLLLLPEQFIQLLFTTEYVSAALPAILLVVGQLLMISVGPAGITIEGLGRTRLTLFNTLLLIILNSVGDIIFIPMFGITGAALGTALAVAMVGLLSALELYYLRRIWPFSWSLAKVWIAGLIALCIGYIFIYLDIAPKYNIIYIPAVLGICYLSLLLFLSVFSEPDIEVAKHIDSRFNINVFTKIINYGID